MAYATIQTRLCPHCANSIAVDALNCPYCKADLVLSIVPEWPSTTRTSNRSIHTREGKTHRPIESDFGRGVAAIRPGRLSRRWQSGTKRYGAAYGGTATRSSGTRRENPEPRSAACSAAPGSSREQERNRQPQNQARRDTKEVAAARKRLSEANRGNERLASSRAAATQRPAPRAADSLTAPPSPARARRAIEPGNYETLRSASVYEKPAGSARVVTRIAKGTQVTVVRSIGEWLEIAQSTTIRQGFSAPMMWRLTVSPTSRP